MKDKEEPTSPTVTTVHPQGTLTGVPTQTVAKINSVQGTATLKVGVKYELLLDIVVVGMAIFRIDFAG